MVPVTAAQRRMYLSSILRPNDTGNVWGTALAVAGDLSTTRLASALKVLHRRHDALRSGFLIGDGEVLQVVHDAAEGAAQPLIDVVEAQGDSPGARRAWADTEARKLLEVPFDIESGPLWRTRMIRISPRLHLVVFVFHHLVIDEITIQIFAQELRLAYADPNAPALAVPAVQYADFLGDNGAPVDHTGLDYWCDKLAGIRPPWLPEDGRADPDEAIVGELPVTVPENAAADFAAFCADRSVTPFTGLLAVYFVALKRWAGAGDITVGSPVVNRPHSTLFRTMGFFANTVALRCPAAPSTTFEQFLASVSETVQDALDYQDVPFDAVVDALAPQRDVDRNPLFQAAISYGSFDSDEAWALDGLEVAPVPELAEMAGLQFDLMLDVRPFSGELVTTLIYDRRRFSDAAMQQFGEAYAGLLHSLTQAPEAPLAGIPLLDRAGLARVLALGVSGEPRAGGRAEATSGWELFARTAAAVPDRDAVIADGERLTFAELADRARRMAAGLRAHGVRTGTVVGICLPRRGDLIAAMLATWCAGGAFLLLDPQDPVRRHGTLLREAGAALVIGEESVAGTPTVPAAALTAGGVEPPNGEGLGGPAAAPAYVLFTSSSTGKPKGVVADQAGLVALATTQLAPMYARLPEGRQVNVGGLSSLTSGAFVNQCLGMIAFGHRLLLLGDRERTDPLRLTGRGSDPETAIDVLDCSSSDTEILVEAGLLDVPYPPKIVSIGGEVASGHLWRRLHEQSGLIAFNSYGVTECTAEPARVEIRHHPRPVAGRANDTSRIYVVDDQLRLLPPLFVGEVCIGGPGVAQGYAGRPAHTSERFVADPFSPVPGQRMYRTGDRGRLRPDGQLELWGRADDQLKVRGVRIEPGELEAVLRTHPDITRAAVIATDPGTRTAQLVAYVVPGEADRDGLTSSAVREFLRGSLPAAMLPDRVEVLEDLPMTPAGTLDRKALSALRPPSTRPDADRGVVAPVDPRAVQLCQIVAEVVGVSEVGLDDNFFLLGGNSLLAMQVTSRVRAVLGRELNIRTIFEAESMGEMAAQLAAAPATDRPARPALRRRASS
ncbi:condensation domain-containing protein [Actinoplanes sp. NPDC023801]|uniref:non-ribosomal peptide synthetase n=1 Tax=Actinoplanes sp. NPDC023801 TaxID=3154595 RepID=UPI0033D7E8B5